MARLLCPEKSRCDDGRSRELADKALAIFATMRDKEGEAAEISQWLASRHR